MQAHELQGYVNQICETLTVDHRLDLSIGVPLIQVAEAISDVAKALDRIADAVEKAQS